jgi:hypothetical protein
MKKKMDMFFQWKSMGAGAYIPIIILLLISGYTYFNRSLLNFMYNVLPMIELIVPLQGLWWIVFIFINDLEEEGSETIFSYPVKRYKLGIVRVIKFIILYLVLVLLLVYSFNFYVEIGDINLNTLAMWLCTWSFCVSSMAFAFMTITSSSAATIAIVIGIWCLQGILSFKSIFVLLLIGIISLILGQKFLDSYKDFK